MKRDKTRARNSYQSNTFPNAGYLIRWKISNEEEKWHIFSRRLIELDEPELPIP